MVTGAAAFIGSNFTGYWAAQHPDDHIVALDAAEVTAQSA
jgi:dTDP-D-glucose 4,6-dehydratase